MKSAARSAVTLKSAIHAQARDSLWVDFDLEGFMDETSNDAWRVESLCKKFNTMGPVPQRRLDVETFTGDSR
jgi:hypothetical protein